MFTIVWVKIALDKTKMTSLASNEDWLFLYLTLEYCGIDSLEWFENYLNCAWPCVRVNNKSTGIYGGASKWQFWPGYLSQQNWLT